jgi:hypothetical protein
MKNASGTGGTAGDASQKNYLQAFLKFSNANLNELRYKPFDGHLLVEYEGETFMVSHANDFKNDYKFYFEHLSYSEIYTQTPEQLWNYFLNELCDLEIEDLIVEIFRSWETYWVAQKNEIKGGKKRYELMRNESFQGLQVFFKTLQINKTNAIKNTTAIDDTELIPIIAVTFYNQYNDKDLFYEVCIRYIISNGKEIITDGETFQCVCIQNESSNSEECYYIYNPMFEFNDA